MENQSDLLLEKWGLPRGVLEFYKKRGITRMFPWQMECLTKGSVLNGGNLIYSAPTSAGKTLVAEILVSQCVFERQKKALIILPFVSVVREKMFYFQEMYGENGARVEGFMGGHTPSASFQQVQVAVCTIEKANSIVNKMLEEKNLDALGAVVVDELHLLGDPYRGYLLELLLTKLKFVSEMNQNMHLQIIGMSATLPNLHMLAKWLNADLYFTDFRPVPLSERMKCGKTLFNNKQESVKEIAPIAGDNGDDSEHVGYLCIETIETGRSVLIFCPTKLWCENLAMKLATYFRKLGCSKTALNEGTCGYILRQHLNLAKLKSVVDHLKMCPVGLDKDLEKTVPFGVAFHHAGLTLDERDVVEGSFRNGSIKVLCATSTLSSGVNLPARRVIIRSPMSFGGVMDVMTYQQMIGRAGRMGVDTEGESVLICKRGEERIGAQLMRAQLRPIESCLGSGRLSASLKRAILEAIGGGLAATAAEVAKFAGSTFLASCSPAEVDEPLATCLQFLEDNQLIRMKGDQDGAFAVTQLGEACLASALPPDEGLALFMELDRARRCFVLDSDLHIIYQITPFSVSEQWTKIDWLRMLNILEHFPPSLRRVAELVGVQESFLVKVVKGKMNPDTPDNRTKLSIHRRFYTALALQDLIMEVPLTQVAHNFDCNKGMLQSLQQSAATYAGMVAEFARRLRWSTIELIVSEFQERLQFGVQRELCELMRLPSLSAVRARALFNSGITSLPQVAASDVSSLENAFLKTVPFSSHVIWITGRAGISVREAAQILRKEARDALELELGVRANWESSLRSEVSTNKSKSTEKNAKSVEIKTENQSVINAEGISRCVNKVSQNVSNRTENKRQKVKGNLQNGLNKTGKKPLLVQNHSSNKTETPFQAGNCESQKLETEQLSNRELKNDIKTISSKSASCKTGSLPLKVNCRSNAALVETAPLTTFSSKGVSTKTGSLPQQGNNRSNAPPVDSAPLTNTSFNGVSTKTGSLPLKVNSQSNAPPVETAPLTTFSSKGVSTKTGSLPLKVNSQSNAAPAETAPLTTTSSKGVSTKTGSLPQQAKSQSSAPPVETAPLTTTSSKSISTKTGSPPQINSQLHAAPVETTQSLLPCELERVLTEKLPSEITQTTKNVETHSAPVSISVINAILDCTDWQTPVKNPLSAYEKSTILEKPDEPFIRRSRQSLDIFDCLTPVGVQTRAQVDSPDIFNQSLTFDTQLARICDLEQVPDLPPSPVKSDDLGYLSNSSSIITADHSAENVLLETVGESFFFKDKRKRNQSEDDVLELDQMKRCKREELENDDVIEATPCSEMNWETFHVVDVGRSDQVFETFCRELERETVIGLSVACRRKIEQVKKIGAQIGGHFQRDESNEEECFSFDDIVIDGFAVYWHFNYVFYLPCQREGLPKCKILDFMKKLSGSGKTIRMFDTREQLRVLGLNGMKLSCSFEDPKVAAWLLNSAGTEESLRYLLNEQLPQAGTFADFLGSSAGVGSPALDIQSEISARTRACSEALLTFHLIQKQLTQLDAIKLLKVFQNIEMPIIRILANMEVSGLKFNETKLFIKKTELEAMIESLERTAHSIAGRKFALASHTAVAKILYTEMRLGKDLKKKQTSKECLELLQNETNHPLPGVILQWRKLKAIVTKTLYPLLRLLPSTCIHGSCKTFTVTGRISMSEPNLQNVAKDFDVQGKTIRLRELFVPESGFVFISADYCQIELRLLAELSADRRLIKDIVGSCDVFNSIAASIFGIAVDEVTSEHRQRAKQTCYGIIYGIGARSLAQQLRISVSAAETLMADFNLKYEGVRSFVKNSIIDCRNLGYVSTMNGRRRYLPGIASLDAAARSEAERQAVNTRIQGSAADLVKVAMTEIDRNSHGELKLVMQLHDEVIYEVRKDFISRACIIVKTFMERASGLCQLEMPFPVKVKIGPSWGELLPLSL